MLEFKDIKEIISGDSELKPKNSAMVEKAILHEERVRFHSEMTLGKDDIGRAYDIFMKFVGGLLPEEKVMMFQTLFQFPVATVPLMDEAYISLRKIFDGRNPIITYDFSTKEYEGNWREYRDENLSEKFWEEEGFEMMKSGINSLVAVDLPEEQEGDRPEPYVYFIQLENVVFVHSENGVDIEWVIFKMDGEKLGVFDDTSYRVFDYKNKAIGNEPITESLHDLGYCPVRFFWTSSISQKNPLVKKSPLSSFLGKLDMLLFYEIANEHLNLFARFPIYSAFEEDCDYEDQETGRYCKSGFILQRNGGYVMNGAKPLDCPVCSSKKLDGPGTYIKIEAPNKMNGNVDLRNPVQITSIPKDSLDYNNLDIRERRTEIYKALTGFNGMSINNQAVNEKQVGAIFESMEAALRMPQMNFEKVMSWSEKTACLLRYGKEIFKGVSINLGTSHYVMDSTKLMELYLQHKEKGAPFGVLDMWEDRYYESEFKNDNLRMKRYGITKNLDPLRHTDNVEALDMVEKGRIDEVTYLIKANLSSFILRFERENGINIVEFGKNIDLNKKVESINQAFVSYAQEMMVVSDTRKEGKKESLELYGIGVRSGGITPQQIDEENFRSELGYSPMSIDAIEAWKADKGIRKPTTLKSQAETEEAIKSE
ncbi:MAG: hypothetical protein Unbinned5350contig1001_50 [Prokaryotic dsDNA virus sp.]|nr:MAG: hypothetical protein Unbinned5350contig1001_50 [Prokaryotic dsDNA virus sp.]|tara:strand:- start:5152 stop:7107 length:1956 start_codon:yes stop_codon:yes gene_type:complete